jgi:hypothetical protein
MSQNVPGDRKIVPLARAPKETLLERIEAFLDANAPNEFNLKTIARHMDGASVAAVKKCIQRALLNPKARIAKVHEGWYRAARTPEILSKVATAKRLGIHGIEIAGKCPDDPTRSRLMSNSDIKINSNGQYSFEFLGRIITITLYPKSPTILVQLSSTNNPLTFEEFNGFCFWLFGWGATAKILDHTWEVKQFGWNVDFLNLDMTKSGFKRITLKAFRNDYFQIYQKQKDVVRFEAHMNPRDMNLTDMQRCILMLLGAIGNGNGEAAAPAQMVPPDRPEGYA